MALHCYNLTEVVVFLAVIAMLSMISLCVIAALCHDHSCRRLMLLGMQDFDFAQI